MVYPITNTMIGGAFFNGEIVPGPNTVATARNTYILGRIDSWLKGFLLLTTLPTTGVSAEDFEECSYLLYEQFLNGNPNPRLPAKLMIRLRNRYKQGTFKPVDPTKYE